MRLVSFELATPSGAQTRIGAVLSDGRYADLQSAFRAVLGDNGATREGAARIAAATIPSDMVAFIENGVTALDAAQSALDWVTAKDETGADGATLVFAPEAVKLLSPLPRPPLIRDFMAFETHLKNIYPKLGREIPPQWYEMPVYYKGNPSAVGAHGDAITMPTYATNMDFEFEFAAVIGRGGANIAREDAHRHIFGFMIYNDFSAREIQQREMSVGLGPAKGKDFERGHVFGPWLVTADEIADVYGLRMVAEVSGKPWCDTSTSTMHWRFDQMIAHASMNERLVPGEIFGSGTVGGGSAAEMGKVLGRGDTVTLRVDGLGELRNSIA
ncbi:fumarylacetoacetate hydrolase family protein [Devosia sp. ZB163]|uniref:fumarylacetoacetate hydrolase family protein n=1 Tax=Devosia sp. ZB163 TaxID=3025938 RepID=UPI00235FA901|nr:fumarylacetoacetate hydrolase family protein [Devosia sp. ZB163]MDC9823810.1 fumarylacetoacetate hydrolase family protein [Devosia sp. ZB163]